MHAGAGLPVGGSEAWYCVCSNSFMRHFMQQALDIAKGETEEDVRYVLAAAEAKKKGDIVKKATKLLNS